MIFKNILFGICGSAIVGGVGYGIYSSSQTNENEKLKTDEKGQGVEDSSGKTNQEQNEGEIQSSQKLENDEVKDNNGDQGTANSEGGTGTENTQVSEGTGGKQTDSGVKTNTETISNKDK